MNATQIKQIFIEILGTESVGDPSTELVHRISLNSEVACRIYPQTQTELQLAIALAQQHKLPILSSELSWGKLINFSDRDANLGIAINTSRLNKLIDHAVGDLTVTCEAGMKFADLQNILAKSGQFLAIDPAYANSITIGEIVNTGNTGSLRQRYGGVRDMLLGISFVRADGELAKAGGRVVKNVAGYDLMKLMTGAYGTLGVISQLTFRLYPLPQSDRTVIITGQAEAINAIRAKILISTLTPLAIDILSKGMLTKLGMQAEIGLIIRFGGLTQGVEEQIRRLAAIAQSHNLEINSIEGNTIWDEIQNWLWQSGRPENQNSIVCKIGTLPDIAIKNLVKISTQIEDSVLQIHASSGIGILKYESSDPADILAVRKLLETTGGFLTVLEAPSQFKNQIDVWGYTGNATEVMTALKQKFDPHNLLNPH